MAQQGERVMYGGRIWDVLERNLHREAYVLQSRDGGTVIEVTERSLAEDRMKQPGTPENKLFTTASQQVDQIVKNFAQRVVDRQQDGWTISLTENNTWDTLVPSTDTRFAEPQCDGWHLLYDPPDPLADADAERLPPGLIEYAGSIVARRSHACDDLKDCWVRADWVIDEELGTPVAIKIDERVIYYKDGDGNWCRERDDYPDLEEWL